MKRFISRSIGFSIPLLLLCAGAEMLARKIPNDYLLKRDYVTANLDNIEVLYLGSSHAYYGINPEYADHPSFNIAYVSQTLDCDLAILETYFNDAPRLRAIAVPISYFTMLSQLDQSEESWRMKNYVIYYGIRTPDSNLAHGLEVLSNSPMNLIKRIKKYHLRHKAPTLCSPLGFGLDFIPGVDIDLEESARNAVAKHTIAGFQGLEENRRILSQIIEFARERDMIVMLYTPPAYTAYTNELEEEQLALMQNTCAAAADIHDHVYYVDYMNNPAFGPSDFFDADHLNQAGADKFTRMISAEIGLRLEEFSTENQ